MTSVNGCGSDVLVTTCGVPQGSVLGPLLFLIYINDIFKATTLGKIRLFADDTNIFVIASDLKDLFTLSNQILVDILKWTVCNKLSINLDKTNYMIFKPTPYINNMIKNLNLNIHINNYCLTRVSYFKYLGVWLDEDLNWKVHVNNLVTKINSLIGILYRKKYVVPSQCRKNLYFAFAHSSIVYLLY